MDGLVGSLGVFAESNRGHDVNFYTERLLARLLHVSDNAPEPIRAQASAYKEQMRSTLLEGLKRAVRSDRTTLAAFLRANGMPEAAQLVLTAGD